MKAEQGEDAPAEARPQVDQAAIPEAFQQALSLSPFVTEPAHMEQAVRAADEVWKVATDS